MMNLGCQLDRHGHGSQIINYKIWILIKDKKIDEIKRLRENLTEARWNPKAETDPVDRHKSSRYRIQRCKVCDKFCRRETAIN